jgi:hypothetical protein
MNNKMKKHTVIVRQAHTPTGPMVDGALQMTPQPVGMTPRAVHKQAVQNSAPPVAQRPAQVQQQIQPSAAAQALPSRNEFRGQPVPNQPPMQNNPQRAPVNPAFGLPQLPGLPPPPQFPVPSGAQPIGVQPAANPQMGSGLLPVPPGFPSPQQLFARLPQPPNIAQPRITDEALMNTAMTAADLSMVKTASAASDVARTFPDPRGIPQVLALNAVNGAAVAPLEIARMLMQILTGGLKQ